MEGLQKNGSADVGTTEPAVVSPKALLAARVVLAIAAAALVAAFFLPWGSADEEFREAAMSAPSDLMFYEPAGLTVEGATDLSLLEYAQVYGSMGNASWGLLAAIIYAVLVFSVLALLLSVLGKPIGTAVFGILCFAVTRFLAWDFADRGVLPNSTHEWGVASGVYLAAIVVLIVTAVALWLLKRRRKTVAPA